MLNAEIFILVARIEKSLDLVRLYLAKLSLDRREERFNRFLFPATRRDLILIFSYGSLTDHKRRVLDLLQLLLVFHVLAHDLVEAVSPLELIEVEAARAESSRKRLAFRYGTCRCHFHEV